MPWDAELNPESESGRFRVGLFSEEADYIAAGGIAGSAAGPVSLAQLRYLGMKDTGSRLISWFSWQR